MLSCSRQGIIFSPSESSFPSKENRHRFGDARDTVRSICGADIANKIGLVWGLDEEGEVRNVWRPTKVKGLWFGMGKPFFFSSA